MRRTCHSKTDWVDVKFKKTEAAVVCLLLKENFKEILFGPFDFYVKNNFM